MGIENGGHLLYLYKIIYQLKRVCNKGGINGSKQDGGKSTRASASIWVF
jgi:hypothetical protein